MEPEAESENNGLEVRKAEPEAVMKNPGRIDRDARLKGCMGMLMGPAAGVGSMKAGDQIEEWGAILYQSETIEYEVWRLYRRNPEHEMQSCKLLKRYFKTCMPHKSFGKVCSLPVSSP